MSANQEQPCYAGRTYTFNFTAGTTPSNIYLIANANANDGYIKVTYYAQTMLSAWGVLGIILAGIVVFSLIITGIIFYVSNKLLRE